MMQRRTFLGTGSAALIAASKSLVATERDQTEPSAFHLKYAPHFGMFENLGGRDPVDQLKFAANEGFTAWRTTAYPQPLLHHVGPLPLVFGHNVFTQPHLFRDAETRVWEDSPT